MKEIFLFVAFILTTLSSQAEEMLSYQEDTLSNVINKDLEFQISPLIKPTPSAFYELESILLESAIRTGLYPACAVGAGVIPVKTIKEVYDSLTIKDAKYVGLTDKKIILSIKYEIDNGSLETPAEIEVKFEAPIEAVSRLINVENPSKSSRVATVSKNSKLNDLMLGNGSINFMKVFSIDDNSAICF